MAKSPLFAVIAPAAGSRNEKKVEGKKKSGRLAEPAGHGSIEGTFRQPGYPGALFGLALGPWLCVPAFRRVCLYRQR